MIDLDKLKTKARRAVKALNDVLEAAREDYPDAQWYLDGTQSLCLMSGEPHDGKDQKPQYDRILFSVTLHRSDGGDW